MVLLRLSALALAGAVYALNGSVTDYAPRLNQPCPNITATPLVRSFTPKTQSLNSREKEYVNTRLSTVIADEWKKWITDIGYDLNAFNNNFPIVGAALSGGGYRAAQFSAGVLCALDARNETAKAAGTGGLLQVTSYLAGLSGGSWFMGSLYANDFPNIRGLVEGTPDGHEGWLLDIPLATPDGNNIFSDMNQFYYGSVLWSVVAKGDTGVFTSLTDPWSRMVSYHFLNQTDRGNFFTNNSAHGAGQLWSEVPLLSSWQQHQVPFPIVQADSRPVDSNLTTILGPESTVYEMTPEEFGSWDPSLSAMINMSYAGTHLTNGQPDNSTACTTHFDQTGFVMGTSASLFNQLVDFVHNTIQGFDDSTAKSLLSLLGRQLGQLRTRKDDVANWPNPFYNLAGKANFQDMNSTWLELIDGSSNQENMPLGQLFVRARAVDVIVAIDDSSDTLNNWPNGTSLLFSAARNVNLLESSHQPLPPLPGSVAEFISTGVNMRPTFFGCFPTQNPPEYPMVISLPSAPPFNGDDPVSNPSTFKLDYTQKQTQLLLDQVFNTAIGGYVPNTKSADPDFGKALQCAAIDRARYKVSPVVTRSSACAKHFERYCWDPSNPPSVSQLPGRKLVFVDPDPEGVTAVTGFLSRSKVPLILAFLFLGFIVAALSAFLILRKRRRNREATYQKVMELHDEDEPPFVHHDQYRDSSSSEPAQVYQLGRLQYEPFEPEERP